MATHRSHRSASIWVNLLLCLATTTCSDDGGTGPSMQVATRLEIANTAPIVLVNTTYALQARVLDQNGASMPNVPISWSSDDNTTATIDATTGVLTGVAGGEVRIGASAAALSTSIVVLVSYPVGDGQTIVRLRATSDTVTYLADIGASQFADRLGTDDGDYSYILSVSDRTIENISAMLTIYAPGKIATGTLGLSSVDVDALFRSLTLTSTLTPVVQFVTDVGTNHPTIWLSTGGWFSSNSVELPVGPGRRMGQYRGRLCANVSSYSVTWNADEIELQPLGIEGTLYAEIATSFGHVPVAVVSAQMVGGPYPGVAEAYTADYTQPNVGSGGYLRFELADSDRFVGDLTVRAAAEPEVGSWTISGIDPTRQWPTNVDYWATAEFAGETIWYSKFGVVHIDRTLPPPGADLTGELRGSLTLDMAEWSRFSPAATGRIMHAYVSFHVPWLNSSEGFTPPPQLESMNATSTTWPDAAIQYAAIAALRLTR